MLGCWLEVKSQIPYTHILLLSLVSKLVMLHEMQGYILYVVCSKKYCNGTVYSVE